MAATGKTPILLYGSTTATNTPSAGNLTNSSDGCEIAINVADKNLFFKDSTNVVNTVPIRQSSASSNGWLSSTDWSTFNSKQPAGTYVTSVTGTAPVVSSGGTTPAISMAAATGSVNGYLTSTDWTTFNNKASTSSPTFTGNVTLSTGNLVIGTSGKGIDFSATAGTGTSELLADYEEGTWTPEVFAYGGGASNPTFTGFTATGNYTKIGRQVTITGRLYWTGRTGGGGAFAIQGLPYTIANENGFLGVMKYNVNYLAGTGVSYTIYTGNLMPRFYADGQARIKFGYAGSGNITNDLLPGDLLNSTQYFEFSVVYFN